MDTSEHTTDTARPDPLALDPFSPIAVSRDAVDDALMPTDPLALDPLQPFPES